MKGIFTLLAIAALAAAGWYFFMDAQESEAPTNETPEGEMLDSSEEEMTGGEEMEESDLMNEASEEGATGESAEAKVFTIEGSNFEFDVEEIRVQEGDTVTINFESADGFHDWVVDEFNAATERVQTGGTTSVTFVADAAGTYEYYCSVGNHREQGMVGTLIVE